MTIIIIIMTIINIDIIIIIMTVVIIISIINNIVAARFRIQALSCLPGRAVRLNLRTGP